MTSSNPKFEWYGEPADTMREIISIVLDIARRENEMEAAEFLDDYGTFIERQSGSEDGRDVARSNIGYMMGYYGDEDRKVVYDLFECAHPIFGRTTPTSEEAFEAGKKWALNWDDPQT